MCRKSGLLTSDHSTVCSFSTRTRICRAWGLLGSLKPEQQCLMHGDTEECAKEKRWYGRTGFAPRVMGLSCLYGGAGQTPRSCSVPIVYSETTVLNENSRAATPLGKGGRQ